MKHLKNTLFIAALLVGVIFISCAEDDPGMDETPNEPPTVENPVSDQSYQEGFGTATINLSGVFDDAESSVLSLDASSSDETVVTVGISGQSLTITEVGVGTATITITAEDDEGETASDQFIVSVNATANNLPVVDNPIDDLTFTEGFGEQTFSLVDVFSDVETMMLQFSAESSETGVVTVSLDRADLTITEVGLGTSIITVTAIDEDGGTASDEFEVSVTEGQTSECTNDNSLNTTNTACDNTPSVTNIYTEVVNGGTRTITTNRVPDHDYGNQIANMGVRDLISTTETFTLTSDPTLANRTTSILTSSNRPAYDYGIGLNGVPIDPAPAEPFIFEDSDGEFNWDWVFEPNNNRTDVGLDCNTAHLQPTDDNTLGLIHYHGDMVVYANSLLAGLGDGTTTPTEPVQIGWASDGFPIVYKYGPTSDGAGVELLESGYQLKSGSRPGDGESEPCGEYNGKYTNDYEFVNGAGDLDECNGISRSITLTTPSGIEETFDYFYVITDAFPIIGRCLSGTPADDFDKIP